MKTLLMAILFVLTTVTAARAGDLYRVDVTSHEQARALRASRVTPVTRLENGYLVLVDAAGAERLAGSALKMDLLAADISLGELAVDMRPDRRNVGRFPLLFEQDGLRLFRVSPAAFADSRNQFELSPLHTELLQIEYRAAEFGVRAPAELPPGLDTLIERIEYDSLVSYLYRLQAFWRRTVATDSNYASREWIASKLREFGYDTVVIDSFYHEFSGVLKSCQNVVARKTGSVYPDHHIVVGAHRDAVAASPGADDNGTGTAAVLEIARALADVDVDVTIDFVLFDAEEIGLYGSWEYASRAFVQGEQIICMLNMDMIGHLTNSSEANLFYGNGTYYPLLWDQIADSLVGIHGILAGTSGGSDHYPFHQLGWPAVFLAERNFSTVYHSARDSTSYVNFDYFTRMTKGMLATAYTVAVTSEPPPVVTIEFDQSLQDITAPGEECIINLTIAGSYGSQLVPGSAEYHWSVDDSPYTTEPLVDLGDGAFRMVLPAAECGRTFTFYITVDEVQTGVWYEGSPEAPHVVRVESDQAVVWADDFDDDLGWTVWGSATDGIWERAYPAGHGVGGSPLTDASGSGQCFVTGNEARLDDVDGGVTIIYSPLFDFTDVEDPWIRYSYWFYSSESGGPFEDEFEVYISNTYGSYWIPVAHYDMGTGSERGWKADAFRVADYVALTDGIYVRFDAADRAGDSEVEGGLDNVSVVQYDCAPDAICGDMNGDMAGPDLSDLIYIVNYLFLDGPPPADWSVVDINRDGATDLSDLIYLVNFLFLGGPAPDCWL